MGKPPSIPHKEIADYILSGRTTTDAKVHFNFASNNVANLRVWAAFRALGIPRPRFQEKKMCEFCGSEFIAIRRNLRSCGAETCQVQLIKQWQVSNMEKVVEANRKFKKSQKGRVANQRQHRKKRDLGSNGNSLQRWAFGLEEIAKSFRKLKELDTQNSWEYRINHLQNVSKLIRHREAKRARLKLDSRLAKSRTHRAGHYWMIAMRAIQTQNSQYQGRLSTSVWEQAVVKLQAAIRAGEEIREWKRKE